MQPKILIIDDQPEMIEVLKELLVRESYHVLTAMSAEEGLRLLEQESVDIIISDERMPGMQGSEFFGIVRKQYPETVRIILTGYASVESAMRAINEGEIFRFLVKPINRQDLYKAIEDAIASNTRGGATQKRNSVLETLEKQAPGITHVKRDKDGVVIIEPDDT
jgi:DNA-binding NtrC family response regulator